MNNAIQREVSEWCKLWWSRAGDKNATRVLLIGDSITVGYSQTVIDQLKEVATVDYLGSSKSINDPAYTKELTYMLGEYSYKLIHFNNGLHGWHVPSAVYQNGLRQMVQLFRHYAPETKLIWASSTPVTAEGAVSTPHSRFHDLVIERNRLAAEVMNEFHIPINDLFQCVLGNPAIRAADGFHYLPEGQTLLGRTVADFITMTMERS